MEKIKNKVLLLSTESFYTHSNSDAIRVIKGNALVYIVPWNNNLPGRKKLLQTVGEGKMIPSFCYCDINYHEWRFAILPREGKLELEIFFNASTKVLKRHFLDDIGVQNFDTEGFENSIISFYELEDLKDKIYIERGKKNAPKMQEEMLNVMKKAFDEDEDIIPEIDSEVYRVASWACSACNKTIASRKRLESIYGKDVTIPDIIRTSDLICRDIVLEQKWYKDDCGVIIGTRQGEAIACAPGVMGKYRIYYGKEGKCEKLTKKIAEQIDPRVYFVGRTLPERKLEFKDLVSFVLESMNGKEVFFTAFLGVLGIIIGLLLPTLNQKIYDDYIPMGDYGQIMQMCIVIGSFMLGNVFFSIVKNLVEFRISCKTGYDMQSAIYHRVLQLQEKFFREYDSADLARRVMSAGSMTNKSVQFIVVTCLSTILSLIYMIRMFTYSVKMTWIAFLMVLLFALIVWVISFKTVKYEKNIMEFDGKATAQLYQYLNGIDKLRMAGVEERSIYEFLVPFSKKETETIKKTRLFSVSMVLKNVASSIFSMVLYWIIVKKNMSLSMGSFIAFNTAFGSLSNALLQFITASMELYNLKPTYDRLKPIFDAVPESDLDKEIPEEITGKIAVENVTFSYNADSVPILKNISFDIKPGEYIGIVGPSGCGKSTLLKLLLGFETPNSGQILYDNHDLKILDKKALRKKLGVVLQNGKLIAGSIFENITITNSHAKLADVNKVIEAVGLKDDIQQMPMGVHTVLSESSGTISGGQQQRILIARAIFNKPSILLFDEATSALDNITQLLVCESLNKMNITRIVIAHRLSTIKNCDRILVLNNGELLEEGDYETLMKKKGLFYQMANRQIAE